MIQLLDIIQIYLVLNQANKILYLFKEKKWMKNIFILGAGGVTSSIIYALKK